MDFANLIYPVEVAFAEATVGDDSDGAVWIDAFALNPNGWYDHKTGKKHVLDVAFAEEVISNFNNNVRGVDIAIDFEHGTDVAKGKQAAGWLRGMNLVGDKVQWLVKWTEDAAREIKEGKWKYFSPVWAPSYTKNDGTDEKFSNVVLKGSLTNTPVMKGLAPVNFAELLEHNITLTDERGKDHSDPGTEPSPYDPGEPTPREPDDPTPPPPSREYIDPEGKVDEKALRALFGIDETVDLEAHISELKAKADKPETKPEETAAFAEVVASNAALKASVELLEKDKRTTQAVKFAEDFSVTAGEHKYVLTPVAREKLRDAHIAFSEGNMEAVAFSEIISSLGEKENLVELKERGSSADGAHDAEVTDDDAQNAVTFSEEINKLVNDKEAPMSYGDALARMSREKPQLHEAYMKSFGSPR